MLDNNLRRCKDEFKEFERPDVKCREDLNHLKQKIKKLTDKIDKDCQKISDTTNECEESANLIPKLEKDIPSLQQLLVNEEKILEEIKEANVIDGIYGRMDDLGAIDAKYDVSISTACAGLDYIVVETTATAKPLV
ncbi:hypothetical protein H5410_040211 [Solanum commersonii]|uniref:Uncharacterized protein n=1 Tax=Solanum commersonii TaxID=4109 RepID=A0A9J5XN90_SOLCO|nr:hypothetical protein H5410_040211 [Solanum commersonii]